jgi:hypothetical protein
MLAIGALETPHRQPPQTRPFQDGQVAEALRSARFHTGAARLAAGTYDVVVSAFEMQLKPLEAEHLTDDANSGRPRNAAIPWKSMRTDSSCWSCSSGGACPALCEASCACQYAARSRLLSPSDMGLKLGKEPDFFSFCTCSMSVIQAVLGL